MSAIFLIKLKAPLQTLHLELALDLAVSKFLTPSDCFLNQERLLSMHSKLS